MHTHHMLSSYLLSGVFLLWFVGTVAAINTYYIDEQCDRRMELLADDLAFRLNASKHHYYPHNLNCTLTLAAEKNSEKIMFYFKYIDIRGDKNCEIDWLGVYDGDSEESPTVCGIVDLVPGKESKICGVNIYPPSDLGYRTHENTLTFYFHTGPNENYKGFEIILTRFRYSPCDSDEYLCTNRRCIHKSLTCNGLNPCGDDSDCPRPNDDGNHGKMVKIGVASGVGGLVIGMVLMKLLCLLWKKARQAPFKRLREDPIGDAEQKNVKMSSLTAPKTHYPPDLRIYNIEKN